MGNKIIVLKYVVRAAGIKINQRKRLHGKIVLADH